MPQHYVEVTRQKRIKREKNKNVFSLQCFILIHIRCFTIMIMDVSQLYEKKLNVEYKKLRKKSLYVRSAMQYWAILLSVKQMYFDEKQMYFDEKQMHYEIVKS